MAKKRASTKKRAPKKSGKRGTWSEGRTNTHKPNGAMPESAAVPEPETTLPIGEAMRKAVEELGAVAIDDKLAPQQLQQLAECYEDVTRAQAAFQAKAEAAKIAKKTLESATNLLLEKVRSFTHPAPLPLFDQATAEGDRKDMLEAIDAVDTLEDALD